MWIVSWLRRGLGNMSIQYLVVSNLVLSEPPKVRAAFRFSTVSWARFPVVVGLRQSCPLSTILFEMSRQAIEVLPWRRGWSLWWAEHCITAFADDVALMALWVCPAALSGLAHRWVQNGIWYCAYLWGHGFQRVTSWGCSGIWWGFHQGASLRLCSRYVQQGGGRGADRGSVQRSYLYTGLGTPRDPQSALVGVAGVFCYWQPVFQQQTWNVFIFCNWWNPHRIFIVHN